MSKVFGIHHLETKPGVEPATFERFLTEEALPQLHFPGTRSYVLKGERGERNGRYLFVMEFDSVEARDRLFPSPDETSTEAQQVLETGRAVWEKWATLGTVPGSPEAGYTDYLELG